MRDSNGIEGQNISYNEYLLKYESLIIEVMFLFYLNVKIVKQIIDYLF